MVAKQKPLFDLRADVQKSTLVLISLIMLTVNVGPAAAEALANALASAYTNNPTIRAERARHRATDELVSQALSGWRPTVVANGDAGARRFDDNSIRATTTEPAGIAS